MTYLSQDTGRTKAVSAIAVVAVEAGVVLAIISAFSVIYTQEPVDPPMPTDFYPTTPLPSPPPEPKKETILVRLDVIRPLVGPVIRDPGRPYEPPIATGSEGTATHSPPLPPEPKPTPLFTPKGAVPVNAPGSWATTNDYPARDLREGNQGRVGFTLAISNSGKVQSCVVTSSSTFAGLDKATCDLVARRARFRAATDESGAAVAGSYSGAIRWTIPEG